MKRFVLTLVIGCFVIHSGFSNAQPISNADKGDLEILILDDYSLKLEGKFVDLRDLGMKINVLLQDYKPEERELLSVTVIIKNDTPKDILDKIRSEVKKTPIRLINIRRHLKKDIKEEESSISTEEIKNYNKLIEKWENQTPEERNFDEKDLKFVEETYSKMTFDQRLKAKKLPGYLPFLNRKK
ncbi:MAG: hypothetical protein ACQESK_00675 [Bacteroidota bacterium]